jgi:hypothetical protein
MFGLASTVSRSDKQEPRVLIGPHEIAGYYSNLTKGLLDLGVDCDYVTYQSHLFEYGGETTKPALIAFNHWLNRIMVSQRMPFILRAPILVIGKVVTSLWGVAAIFRYNVFVFGFGKTLLPFNADLPILKLLGKRVVSNLAHGSEARPPYTDGSYNIQTDSTKDLHYIRKQLKRVVRTIQMHEKYASCVIAAPYTSSLMRKPLAVNFFAIGIPFANDQFNCLPDEGTTTLETAKGLTLPIRILHAPSNPIAKGTTLIVAAVNNLKARGYKIDFCLVTGRPFSEVLEEVQKCDFIVDQCFSDTPMAGFATEAAWFGKPSVVGGYGLTELRKYVDEEMWPPSKTCLPDEIESAIEDLIVDSQIRIDLGRKAQIFVQSKWKSVEVAKRFIALINNQAPVSWSFSPSDVSYLEGGAQSIETTRKTVRHMIHLFGIRSLNLVHRLDLEAEFLELAGIDQNHESK